MGRAMPWAFTLLLLPGCATAPSTSSRAPAAEEVPDNLAGLPAAVIGGRALFDLDSGDPDRVRRARSVLLALPEGPGLDGLRDRVRTGDPGSPARLEALAVLAERGDPLEGIAPAEKVTMCLREMVHGDAALRSTLLALDRLRGMGEAARRPLRREARSGGPYEAEALRCLRTIFHEGAEHRSLWNEPWEQ
jgi:hypothetical protein